jgi:hypothetical protein
MPCLLLLLPVKCEAIAVFIDLTSDSDDDVSTSFSTRPPPSSTLSPTIKQEVAFLAENIDAFDDLDEELSGPGELLSLEDDGKFFTNPTYGIYGSPAFRLLGFTASRSYAAIATIV